MAESKNCRKCHSSKMPRSLNPNWRGGRILTSGGYIGIRVEGKYRFEHVLIMEEYLGRKLLSHENVHHINGVKTDNRLENLELWSKSQPAGQRVKDKLAWARYIIETYE